jgi:hypothetical protein
MIHSLLLDDSSSKDIMSSSWSDSMDDSSIELAIRLNNESASLLCSGEDAKAVARLSKSLTSMRRMIGARRSRGGRQCVLDGSSTEASSTTCGTSSERPALPSSLQIAALRDSDYFIYNRCMEVPSFHQRSLKHLSLYSACIVLNLALAHHRLGIKGHRCSLNKAEKMYYVALKLLSGPSLPSKDETVLSMRIFAVNNLVQVHQERCQYDKAKAAVRHLSVLLDRVLSTGTFFHKEELRRFVLNASLWEPPQMAASA